MSGCHSIDYGCICLCHSNPNLKMCNCECKKNFNDILETLRSWYIPGKQNILSIFERIKDLSERIKELEDTMKNFNSISDLLKSSLKVLRDEDGLRLHKCPICGGHMMVKDCLINKRQ
jgi:23S rRNA A2030 N6-methylase RlmJ